MLLLEVPVTNPFVCVENQVIVAALFLGTCSSTSCPELHSALLPLVLAYICLLIIVYDTN